MPLDKYREKRDFDKTSEPAGGEAEELGMRFVVHEHHASRLHFDLRLEAEGVLKSWAIPKGPSMNPGDKRLAVMVEDHPLEYISFRGEIAEGYGAGHVEIWDSGTYETVEGELGEGKLVFELFGAKLRGQFHLVRLKGDKNEWLLIKGRDEFADPDWKMEQVLEGGSRADMKKREAETDNKDPTPQAEDPMPTSISPMLATLIDKPFSDPQWIFEPKWDGYRAISYIEQDSFRFISRGSIDMAGRFPQAQAIPGLVDCETAVLDGELVAVDSSGKPNFQLLQNAARSLAHGAQLAYYVFDLLYLNGQDLRKRPLIERKALLKPIIRPSDFLKYCDHIAEHGERLYEQAQASGLEGIVAKRAESPYVEKRTSYWLKIKAERRQEVVIAGYTHPRRSRERFGALVVGVYGGEELLFAGQIGSGFSDASLREMHELMQPLVTDNCPFATPPKTNEPATWLRPELVCEVKFAEWTGDGILRQPVFLGLRPDKSPSEAVREEPAQVRTVAEPEKPRPRRRHVVSVEEAFAGGGLKGDLTIGSDNVEVPLTNLDKTYWPDEGYTKGDMLRYYYQVRETIIPHLAGRPLILRRFPNGIADESFYQHNLQEAPGFVRQVQVTEDGAMVNYATIDSTASLLYVANLGCIAMNPFNARVDDLDKPDWIVIDLDPEEATFDTVCEVALVVKDVLDEVGLLSYPKTSGSRGMHVYVPVEPIYTHQQIQNVGKIIASIVVSRVPKVTTIERMKKERGSTEVYVDYLQNASGKTMAGQYSVRAVPGATVSTPLTWEEVTAKPDKGQFTMFSVPERIASIGDIFQGVLTRPQKLSAAIEGLAGLLDEVKKGK